ncbi:hypothetical protein ABL78_7252 [Leptomonas seymouri]|uniref:Uncharacterized protein n=1 Tax=Leptomonas seymouri TaxID=5684 RepID=A0A0N1I288_LEPSE|nr:hypothetical protein ABL78_7252 [Leptomonas seymouri]|eukprot:KPI83701.1 hypothetical protein ABL78_7252 [Leptomonas seymouri]
MFPGGPSANMGSSSINNNSAYMWNNGLGAALGGVGGVSAGPQASTRSRSSITAGGLTPQQQFMMQQGMFADQRQCCAPCCGPQQQCCGSSPGGCCGPSGGCCPVPGEPVDPFCCAPPVPGQEPPCYVSIYNCFDWTFLLSLLLFMLAIVGFAVVLATSNEDDIFRTFGVTTTVELDAAMHPYIRKNWINNSLSSLSSSGSISDNNSTKAAMLREFRETPQDTADYDVHMPMLPRLSTAVEAAVDGLGDSESHNGAAYNCTYRSLLGSFGTICMEDNLNANTFAVQLSSWTNARATLWFLAMVYSFLTLLYAVLISAQRHSSAGAMGAACDAIALPTITPQEQEEFMKMTPQQQQAFMQEYQQRVAMVQQQHPNAGYLRRPGAGCCGADSGIELYDTPFYEFVRIAWLISGLTAFVWTCNLFISFWAFSDFYIKQTSGPLKAFWNTYASKMNGSLIAVTIFLAWPLCNAVVELAVWLIGILPWLIVRSTCKRGVEGYRPALPLSQLPMYIRTDMFFMDFQDIKRLGFSRQAWIMLTGSDRPFFDSCDDPTVDKDPAMTQLMMLRQQWQQAMQSMMPPWMQQAGAGGMMMNFQQQMMMAGGDVNSSAGGGMINPNMGAMGSPPLQGGTPCTIAMNGGVLPTNSPSATPAEYPMEENEGKTHRHRRRSTHERHRHRDPTGVRAAANGNNAVPGVEMSSMGPSNTNGGAGSSRPRRRHRSRSRSRSKAAFESGAATPVPPGADASMAAVAAAGGHNSPGTTTLHRRRHSRSKEAGTAGRASPTPGVPVPVPPPVPGGADESRGEGGHHRRHSRSRSRSKVVGAGDASVLAAGSVADTQHRHRRRSRSHNRERSASKAATARDLDALMQL